MPHIHPIRFSSRTRCRTCSLHFPSRNTKRYCGVGGIGRSSCRKCAATVYSDKSMELTDSEMVMVDLTCGDDSFEKNTIMGRLRDNHFANSGHRQGYIWSRVPILLVVPRNDSKLASILWAHHWPKKKHVLCSQKLCVPAKKTGRAAPHRSLDWGYTQTSMFNCTHSKNFKNK